jgi:hypothetical protein
MMMNPPPRILRKGGTSVSRGARSVKPKSPHLPNPARKRATSAHSTRFSQVVHKPFPSGILQQLIDSLIFLKRNRHLPGARRADSPSPVNKREEAVNNHQTSMQSTGNQRFAE